MVRDVVTNVGLFLPVGLLALPWRFSTWVDVVSNTVGTAFGGGAAWLVDPARSWIGSLPTPASDPSPGHQ